MSADLLPDVVGVILTCPDWPEPGADIDMRGCGRSFALPLASHLADAPEPAEWTDWVDCPHCGLMFDLTQGLEVPFPIGRRIAPDRLNDAMGFDHVVTINRDGTVSDGPAGIYAPDLLDREVSDPRWAPFGNYTSQQGGGWLMHNCESIGGGMARDILATPGTYVAVVAYWSPDDDDIDAGETGCVDEGWAVFRLADEVAP